MTTPTQVCVKCQKDLPLSKFTPLATGRGFYKKCKNCHEPTAKVTLPREVKESKAVKEVKAPKEPRAPKEPKAVKEVKAAKEPRAKPAPKTEKKHIVVLLSDFDTMCGRLRKAYELENKNKILKAYKELQGVHLSILETTE